MSGTAAGIVSVAVPTARSGAIRASPAVAASRRSIRRTSAAAPRSESADPLRPRVGSRSAPSSRSPSSSTTSVVAFPISTPATTFTGAASMTAGDKERYRRENDRDDGSTGREAARDGRSCGQAPPRVDLGGLGEQGRAAGQAAPGE